MERNTPDGICHMKFLLLLCVIKIFSLSLVLDFCFKKNAFDDDNTNNVVKFFAY